MSAEISPVFRRAVERLTSTRAFRAIGRRMERELSAVERDVSSVWPIGATSTPRAGRKVGQPNSGQHSADEFRVSTRVFGLATETTLANGARYAYFIKSALLGLTPLQQAAALQKANADYQAWLRELREAGEKKPHGVGPRAFLPGPRRSTSSFIHRRARKTEGKLAVEVVELVAKATSEALNG